MKNTTEAKHTLTIEFSSADDLASFNMFVQRAKESTATVAPLFCGLASSAMNRATIKPDDSEELVDALSNCRESMVLLAALAGSEMNSGVPFEKYDGQARAILAKHAGKGEV